MDVDGLLLWIATILILIYPEKHEEESKNKKTSKENQQIKPGKKERGREKGSTKPEAQTKAPR